MKYFSKNIIIILMAIICLYINFQSKYLLNSGSHDDLMMLLRSSQYLENMEAAKRTEIPNRFYQDSDNNSLEKRINIINSHWKTYGLSYIIYNLSRKIIDNSNIVVNTFLAMLSSFIFSHAIFYFFIYFEKLFRCLLQINSCHNN